MSTYKVTVQWDFIVEAGGDMAAKMAVVDLTDDCFQKIVRDPMFSYENLTAELLNPVGAGVDARL